jgi:uncharacterized membrane protein YeaQ/YmgE (transglycosylase-associated protein family)
MNVVVWLFIGGMLGLIASLVMHIDERHGVGINMVVGIAGSLIGGWIVSPLITGTPILQDDFNIVGLMTSLAGGILLLVAASLTRRRKPIKVS